jgi:hypothetical protein
MRYEAELLEHFEITKKDLLCFKEKNLGMYRVDTSRLSTLFLCQLADLQKRRAFNTFSITDVVQGLEGVGLGHCSKKAELFKHLPLKGFWKAHFSDARFLSKNIVNHWGLDYENSPKFLALCEKVVRDESIDPSPYGWQGRLANHLVITAYEERANRKQLTGEWLIFGKWKEKNYYLAATRHSSTKQGDEEIFEIIKHYSIEEFPFLFSEMIS